MDECMQVSTTPAALQAAAAAEDSKYIKDCDAERNGSKPPHCARASLSLSAPPPLSVCLWS